MLYHLVVLAFLSIFAAWTKTDKREWYYITKGTPIVYLIYLLFTSHSLYGCSTSHHLKLLCVSSFYALSGLIFGFIGDILLLFPSQNTIGAISFAVGHILYAIAFTQGGWVVPNSLSMTLVGIGLIFNIFIVFYFMNHKHRGPFSTTSYILLEFYYIFIFSMILTAVNMDYHNVIRLIEGKITTDLPLVTLGGILFFISDLFTVGNVVLRGYLGAPRLSILLYYAAQMAITYSFLLQLELLEPVVIVT